MLEKFAMDTCEIKIMEKERLGFTDNRKAIKMKVFIMSLKFKTQI